MKVPESEWRSLTALLCEALSMAMDEACECDPHDPAEELCGLCEQVGFVQVAAAALMERSGPDA